jgi:hypothetical protein
MPRPKKIRGGDIDPNARFPYIDNIYPPPPNPNLNVLVPWIDNDDQQIGNPPPPPPPLIPIPALQMPPTREEMRERRRVLRGGANAMHQEMFGSGMSSDEMEGEGITDWLQNLYNVITKPREALSEMPKRIWEFQDQYGDWTVTSWEVCREPLSSGLTKFIDLASRGQLLKNKERMKYDDIFHLYSNIYLKDPKTGKTKELRLEKNQRVNIFPIVPYKKGGKCMSVGNIPKDLIFRTVINKDTDKTTWEYSADRFNCQDFTKKRLEAVGLLTEPLRQFVMQDIQELLPNAKIQIQIAKGVTNAASIFENIMQGGEMEGGMMCNCGKKCGCGMKGGYIESHVHMLKGQYPDVTGDTTMAWRSDYAPR